MTRLSVVTVTVAAIVSMPVSEAVAKEGSNAVDLLTDDEIRRIISARIDTITGQEGGVGIVVGLIGPGWRRIISHGNFDTGNPRRLDGNTGFEIASATKVFTALLFAHMVKSGEVAIEDPVERYLPGIKLAKPDGTPITLVDLATHTSGLPFMPDQLPDQAESAGKGVVAAPIYRFLAGYKPPPSASASWDYSNVGYWLLGEALATRTGMEFEDLLKTRVLAPLKLTNTAITLSPEIRANLAVGHDATLQPSGYFSSMPGYSLMPAAGGLVSTTNDLLTFLSVALSYETSALAPAMDEMLVTRRPIGHPGYEQALGWIVIRGADDELIYHDGGSLGFSSSMAWDRKSRIGVVVLSNQMTSVNDIARHLLQPDFPLEKQSAAKRDEIILDSSALVAYAGMYQAEGENGVFQITFEVDHVAFQAPDDWGLPKLRLRAESVKDFFATEVPLRVTFQTSQTGTVSEMLIYPPRGQKAVHAAKL